MIPGYRWHALYVCQRHVLMLPGRPLYILNVACYLSAPPFLCLYAFFFLLWALFVLVYYMLLVDSVYRCSCCVWLNSRAIGVEAKRLLDIEV
jgi:hypothetical protein